MVRRRTDGTPGARGAVHRGPLWSVAALMLGVFMSFQLVMALVLPNPGRDRRWILAAAVLRAVIWAFLGRSWLRITTTELRAGRGPSTHTRLPRAEVVVVREDDRSLNRRARSVLDLA